MASKALLSTARAYLCCAGPRRGASQGHNVSGSHQYQFLIDEKLSYHDEEPMNYDGSVQMTSPTEAAIRIVKAFCKQSKPDYKSVFNAANGPPFTVQNASWWEGVAKQVLSFLQNLVEKGPEKLNGAMKEAWEKAVEVAKDMKDCAKEHPVYATALAIVIILGMLVILFPTLIEALGFGALGPIEGGRKLTAAIGSWAAAWQSTYGAAVPSESLFSYLQAMGMTFGATI